MFVIILGGGSTLYQNGTLPPVNDIDFIYTKCLDNGEDLTFIIVDRNLLYADRLSKGLSALTSTHLKNSEFEDIQKLSNGNSYIENDAEKLKGYSAILNINFQCELKHKHQISREILNSSQSIIFIDKTGMKSSYEVMNMIESYEINKRYFILSTDQRNLPEIIEDYFDKELNTPFDFYYGVQLPYNISSDEKEEIKTQIKVGCKIAKQYLKAGFHNKNIQNALEGYTMNVETPILKGLIYTYGLFPMYEIPAFLEILNSSIYRYQLTDLLLKLLSNFSVNNNLIKLDEVLNMGGWYVPEVYDVILQKIEQI